MSWETSQAAVTFLNAAARTGELRAVLIAAFRMLSSPPRLRPASSRTAATILQRDGLLGSQSQAEPQGEELLLQINRAACRPMTKLPRKF